MTSNTLGGNDVIVEAEMLKGGGGIVCQRLDINGTRKRVRLVVVPTVVM
jgi:hypothetical protein